MWSGMLAIAGVLLLVSLRDAAGQPAGPVASERVVVPSGTLRLTGLLSNPAGTRPLPLVLGTSGVRAQSSAQRQQTVQAGPAVVQVTIRGSGDPIVFIPSRGRGVEDFDDLGARLVKAGYRAILPEPRGIGGSTGPLDGITYHDLASDVAAVIQSVARGPVTVVAHAFGTRVARTLAADRPELVQQLILLAAAGAVPRSAATEATTTRFWETPLAPAQRLEAIGRVFFAPGNDPRVWADGWHFAVARAQRASDGRTPVKDWWAGGSAPMLVLQGREDVIVLPENARRLAAEFPHRVTLVEIPHAGHAMLPEQPDAIATAVLAYLRR